MDRLPDEIEGIEILNYAVLDHRAKWTGRCRHFKDGRLLAPASSLAIGQVENIFYLLGCDSSWTPITRTCHSSIDECKRQAQYEFEGAGAFWREASEASSTFRSRPDQSVSFTSRGPAVVWSGHLTDYSGYAKANRELFFRVANVLDIQVLPTGLENGLVSINPHIRRRIDLHRHIKVGERAPLLRFFGPDFEGDQRRHRICWTMMETYRIHEDMVRVINRNYEELWTPTHWNQGVFEESGVRIPIRVVPLGVNPLIFRPLSKAQLPPCKLLTSNRSGPETPEGFVFVSVGLPSFRKGFDVLVEAFEKAFPEREDVHLILAITHSLKQWRDDLYKQFSGAKSNIWTLEGQFSEHEMAEIYSACDCYVSASRGEGWNLPLCEAAACGASVIAPDNTSHPEILGGRGILFPTEGTAIFSEASRVSKWYDHMPFSTFGKASIDSLIDVMKTIESKTRSAEARMIGLRRSIITRWTWDKAARQAIKRLLEVQPQGVGAISVEK